MDFSHPSRSKPRILFIPVSGAKGIGEYMRCRIIADGIQQQWPNAEITFVLSQQAPYLADVPFTVETIERSATFHRLEVCDLIQRLQPDVVVFDSAGRRAQLKAARQAGARVVFISSRPKKRRKAFKPGWVSLLDEHWIVQPDFIDGNLSGRERFKRRLFGRRCQVRFLPAVYSEPGSPTRQQVLERFGLERGRYVLFAPGGGGSPVAGQLSASEVFLHAAQQLYENTGITPIVIMGPSYQGAIPTESSFPVVRGLPNDQFISLLREAKVAAIGGGSILPQALANHQICICAPVAGDQPHRIQRCHEQGLVAATELDATAIANRVMNLLDDPDKQASLRQRIAAAAIENGLHTALHTLAKTMTGRV